MNSNEEDTLSANTLSDMTKGYNNFCNKTEMDDAVRMALYGENASGFNNLSSELQGYVKDKNKGEHSADEEFITHIFNKNALYYFSSATISAVLKGIKSVDMNIRKQAQEFLTLCIRKMR